MCSTGELVQRVGFALASLDPPATDVGTSLGEDYVALRQLLDRLETVSLRWLAALDTTGVAAADGSVSTAAWVRRHTGSSARAASADVRLARRLHTDDLRPLTTTAQLLDTGQLTVDHARAIARATTTLDPTAFDLAEPTLAQAVTSLGVDAAAHVAAAVSDHAAELHASSTVDPAAARQAAAEASRRLHLSRCGDHYALDALLALEAGAALHAVLEPLSAPLPAAGGEPDLRTAAQRRADGLAEAARRLLTADQLPTHGGHRPQLPWTGCRWHAGLMTEFVKQDLSGARFEQVDFSGARFRNVYFTGALIRGAWLEDVDIDGELRGVRINGVDIGPLVDAELNRRHPERTKLDPADADGFREAWAIVERAWAPTLARAGRLPEELLHERVEGEWSFVETLRHLVFATDAWVRRAILGLPEPYSPLGLPHDEMEPDPSVPNEVGARPSLAEITAVRADRMRTVGDVIAGLTDEVLAGDTDAVPPPGYPPAGSYPVRRCLRAIVNEEWLHRLYAERDLAVLEHRTA